jgi:hypothetical protein
LPTKAKPTKEKEGEVMMHCEGEMRGGPIRSLRSRRLCTSIPNHVRKSSSSLKTQAKGEEDDERGRLVGYNKKKVLGR